MEPPQKKILKVFDQDGLYKTMVIEPSSTTGEICEKFAKKLFLEDSEVVQFSLFIFEGGVRHQLKNTDFPFDYLVKYEKKDYKFFFLNPNGEFISFDKDKQVKKSQSASTSGSAPPKKEPPKPQELQQQQQQKQHSSKGQSGWLLRKRPGRYDKVYAVSKADKYLRLYENEDTDNDPLYELSLENSIIELKQDLHLQLTLGNSERYIFTHESESEIVSWAQELQATMNYTPGSGGGSKTNIIKNASPMGGMLMGGGGGGGGGSGGYIPSSKDLGVKLQSKAENTTTLVSTLIQWVNHILEGKGIKIEETEVLSAFSDGIVFINLIEDLFNQTISYRKGKSVYEMQGNIDKCLEVLKTKCGCDYGRILSSDVTECKVAKIIVRILWSMFISYFCNCEGKEFNVRDKLISWCSTIVLQESSKQIIVDSPSSLRNPMVFAVLVNKFAGSTTLDFNSLQKIKSKQDQAQQIIEAAFNYLSIPMVVDSSFWNDDQLDEKSFLIYLSFYYIYLSGQEEEKSKFLQSCINPRPSVEPEQTISIRDKQLKLMKEKKEEEDRLKKEKEEKEKLEKEKLEKEKLEKEGLEKESSASIASTATNTEPPKPTTVPLKKTISKLPPRKLPPTGAPTTTPSTTSTTPTTTTTTTTTTSPTLTPKQPIGTTIKKPATAPLKLKPVAKPLPQPTPSSTTTTSPKPTTTPISKPTPSSSKPTPVPVPRSPLLEKQDRLEKARLEKEKAEKEEEEFLRKQQEEEEEEQRLLEQQQQREAEEEEQRLLLEQEQQREAEQRELEEKQRQIDQEEAEEEARIRELEEETRKSKERLEKARLDKLAKAQKEREEKEREDREKREKEERERLERLERKHDENDMDTFKLLEDIVTSSSSPTITPPHSYTNTSQMKTTIEEDEQTNSELEIFQSEYNRLQDEEEHINSFLKFGSSSNNNNKSVPVTEPVKTDAFANKHKSIDILSDNLSVLSSLDDIINSIDKKTATSTANDSFNLSTSVTSFTNADSSFLPSSPDLSNTINNNEDETKTRSLTSKVRKPLPTLTKEQQSIIDKQTGLVGKQPNGSESIEQSTQNSTTSISTVNSSTLSINEEKETDTQPHKPPPKNTQGRVVVRICLEGFGDVLFCSFAIGYDTLCGNVRDMVIKKMKVPATEEFEYSLHIVRDGLERVLDDDEILLEAEDKIDRFVFKKNDIDRRLLISNHRPVSSK
ncbi:hypothetical protein ACTA71_007972 [Dictyostelium dimigraforme]